MCSPLIVAATPPKYSRQSAPDRTSTARVSWIGLPVSRVSSSASSALAARSRSAARFSTRPRSVPVIRAQTRWPATAADTAASTVSGPAISTTASSSPVAGLRVSKVAPPPSTDRPPTWLRQVSPAGRRPAAADSAPMAASRLSTKAVSMARALSLSASRQVDSAALSQTPSIMAAIIAARRRASAAGSSIFSACRRLDSIRFW